MKRLRHIEGKTYRHVTGYYIEHYINDKRFLAYLPATGYGSQKIWVHISGSLKNAITAIEMHSNKLT